MVEVNAVLAADAIVGAESLSTFFRGKAFCQLRIGMELRLAPMKLFFRVEDHVGAALDGKNPAANLDGLTDELIEIANGLCVFRGTDDEEMAIGIRGIRAAHIDEANAVTCVHHAINVGFHTNIFMQMLQRLLGRNAGRLRHGGSAEQKKNDGHTQQDRRTHRGNVFRFNGRKFCCFDYDPVARGLLVESASASGATHFQEARTAPNERSSTVFTARCRLAARASMCRSSVR